MSDDAMSHGSLSLRGEKVSIGSPSRASAGQSLDAAAAAGRDLLRTAAAVVAHAASELWPAVSFCGAVALWIAPALLLSRYAPDQLFDALASVSVKPTGGALLTLSLVLAYLVSTGLALGSVAGIPRRKSVRLLLRLAVAPLVTLSLIATLIVAVPLFFGALVLCFPGLV